VRLSARRLNRATLDRQLLLRRQRLSVVDAVGRVVGLQAQEPASPYLALWNRLVDFDPAELDAAFAAHEVVKARLMRITLHAVTAEDYPAFHNAMRFALRAARLGDRRFTSSGLSTADADALVPHLLEFTGRPSTGAQVEAALGERLGREAPKGVWWALRTYAPLAHAPTGGPWSFGSRPAYVTARVSPSSVDQAESERRLARRYLQGFGPASVADLARFATLYRSRASSALLAIEDELERYEGPDGAELFDVPGGSVPAEDVPAPPRLLPMWDSALLGYDDRGRVIPPDYRKLVIRVNGDVLPTLLVDGYVAGVWRTVEGGIEATAFHPLPDGAWAGLAAEARALAAVLADRDPAVYRRYHHWWATLPPGETRLLPG
jgi:Winged helix DNA-binding domain